MKKLVIICVLKSGGDYGLAYVNKLKHMLIRHTTLPYEFICLSDLEIPSYLCKSIKLQDGLPGWWSKIELFREELIDADRIVYFDLDTVILDNIDELLKRDEYFIGLKPFNQKRRKNPYLFGSGIMSWENDGMLSFIYEEFRKYMAQWFKGDQEYIARKLDEKGILLSFWQSLVSGVYSYKRQCKEALPEDAKIVCFHGHPRLPEVKKQWVKENWV